MAGERLNAECLGRVVPGVYDDEADVICRDCSMVRPFADDQRVDLQRLGLEQRVG